MENKKDCLYYIKGVAEILLIGFTIYYGYIITSSFKDKELKLETLKVAVSILDKNPKENDPLREWAIDVFVKYADPKPSEEVRKILRQESLKGYILDEKGNFITDEQGNKIKAE